MIARQKDTKKIEIPETLAECSDACLVKLRGAETYSSDHVTPKSKCDRYAIIIDDY